MNGEGSSSELQQLLADLRERLRRGETIDNDALCAAHPEHADALRMFLESESAQNPEPATPSTPSDEFGSSLSSPQVVDATNIDWSVGRLAALGKVPRSLGDYDLIDPIAHGGMGIVFRARQRSLGRIVAVKVILLGDSASDVVIARFRREAEYMAQLQHPNIVRVFDFGECHGWWYMSMELIDGPNLASLLREHPLTANQSLDLICQITDAIRYAHERGIVHRDLKPSNILIRPNGDACVTDFGIAKHLVVEDDFTQTGQFLGTASYAAPELAVGGPMAATPAIDVYALGAILYEMMVGHPPFRAENMLATLAQVRDVEPVPPRQSHPAIPRDLETICLKCLAKSVCDRYNGAAALWVDLQLFRNGKAILARPISPLGHAWRWCDRHRQTTGLIAALLSLTVILIVGLIMHTISVSRMSTDLSKQNAKLVSAVREYRRVLYADQVDEAAEAWRIGDVQKMAAALLPFAYVEADEEDLRSFAWNYLWRQLSVKEPFRARLQHSQHTAGFSADGRLVAFAGADSVLRVYTVPDFRPVLEASTDQKEINGLTFLADGQRIATTGDDGTLAVWNFRTGKQTARVKLFEKELAYQVVHSAPLGLLAVCGNVPSVPLLDADTLEPRGKLVGVHSRGVESCSLSPDGLRLLTCGADELAAVWDLRNGQWEATLDRTNKVASAGGWTPDGKYVVTGEKGGHLRIFDSHSGVQVSNHALIDAIRSVVVSRQGMVLVGDEVGSVTLFDLRDNGITAQAPPILARWRLHQHRVYGLAMSPDGKYLASASRDNQIAICQPELPAPVKRIERVPRLKEGYTNISVVGPDRLGRVYRIAPDGVAVFPRGATERSQTISLDGHLARELHLYNDTLFIGTEDGWVYRWSAGAELLQMDAAQILPQGGINRLAALDGDRIIVLQGVANVLMWDFRTGKTEREWPLCHDMSLSPDRKTLVNADNLGHRLQFVNTTNFAERLSDVGHTAPINTIVFSQNGERIYTGSSDRTIRRWDVATGKGLPPMRGHFAKLRSIAVDPTETTLASCDDSGSVRLWDLRTGRELFELFNHDRAMTMLNFTSDGRELWGIDEHLVEFRWSCRERAN